MLAVRNPLVHLAWSWVRLPTLTTLPIWLAHHSIVLLPTLTSRGVKYTHDIKHTVLHSNRGPLGLCGISQASNQKEITVGDGGAKHRSMDPPTEWHSVADPHAVATIRQGGPPGPDPTTTPCWAYGLIIVIEANNFGKEFLRMAGIVQMLHAHKPPYDKYSYHAHPKRIRATQPRTQAGSPSGQTPTVPGPFSARCGRCSHSTGHRVCSSPIWLILINLLIVLVPSITA